MQVYSVFVQDYITPKRGLCQTFSAKQNDEVISPAVLLEKGDL